MSLTQGTTCPHSAASFAAPSLSRTTASEPSPAAARTTAATTGPRCQCGGMESKITGSEISISGGGTTPNWPSVNESALSFRPMSTLVLMYSRPWMPSRVGRTISDMSVHIESNPGPLNGPP